MPFGGDYNIIWLMGSIGAALIGLLGFVIQRVSVPKNPEYVQRCIAQLQHIRHQLGTARPQIFNPVTGALLIEQPQSVKELFDLIKHLLARDEENQQCARLIRHVLYPTKRRGVTRAAKRAQKARKRLMSAIADAQKHIEEDEFDDSDAKRLNSAIIRAGNIFIDFEKAMLKAIDESLECWADRIG